MNRTGVAGVNREQFQASGVFMSRNGLYAVIAVLVIALVAFGIYTYQQQQARPGIEVRVDEQGISIDGNG
jgi:hypothetical protein